MESQSEKKLSSPSKFLKPCGDCNPTIANKMFTLNVDKKSNFPKSAEDAISGANASRISGGKFKLHTKSKA